ncbi:hypothetical protein K504DRAFT_246605 [Pleomassaria siparia CBS 279.74]|uniref:Uncharacterized protein n=1 Tax=Pleomassaria siparia CBS 279.74 TaxID=1314801 RepID=A0A6G1KAV7_9PLEO|nr:hypothetical protein K504DRAFT_246605 [Pleomassaria siparia CBS 279.74]
MNDEEPGSTCANAKQGRRRRRRRRRRRKRKEKKEAEERRSEERTENCESCKWRYVGYGAVLKCTCRRGSLFIQLGSSWSDSLLNSSSSGTKAIVSQSHKRVHRHMRQPQTSTPYSEAANCNRRKRVCESQRV